MNPRRASFRWRSIGLGALWLLASVAPVLAFKMERAQTTGWLTFLEQVDCTDSRGFAHWTWHSIPWRLNVGSPGGPGFDKAPAIQAALATWSSVVNTTYYLSYAGTTSAGFTYDGSNTMSWGDADSICNQGLCHAITALYIGPGQVIQEADILFNSSSSRNLDWRTDGAADPCSPVNKGNRVDTRAIATHELGHSLGIAHPFQWEPSYSTATMGANSCNFDGRSLESDDQAALLCSDNRYPQLPSYEGYDEVTNCQTISGWAWNASRPYLSAYVDFLDGSEVFQDLEANGFRWDLYYAGKGNGAHGYSIATPYRFKDGLFHTVSARFSGTGTDLTWSPRTLACSAHMFVGSLAPASSLSTGGQVYTVATQFSSSQDGVINELWYFKAAGESGTSIIHLWMDNGTDTPPELATGDLSGCNPRYGGWCIAPISPVAITAGHRYWVGVNTNFYQSKTDCGIGGGITRGPLTAIASSWTAGDRFPTTGSCSNFFVDVNFDM